MSWDRRSRACADGSKIRLAMGMVFICLLLFTVTRVGAMRCSAPATSRWQLGILPAGRGLVGRGQVDLLAAYVDLLGLADAQARGRRPTVLPQRRQVPQHHLVAAVQERHELRGQA